MKTKTLLIAALMFLGISAAAFAQATYTVGSIPVTAVVSTGQVELTGDVTFSQVNNANQSVLGTITLTYPVPITEGTTSSPAPIAITGTTGDYATFTPTILSIANGQTTGVGQVVIRVPGGAATGSFTLTGVRVAVAGTTLSSLSANISSTNNAITAGQTSVIVISSIAPGLGTIKTTTAAKINATTGSIDTSPVNVTIKEGFLNAFGSISNSTAAGVRITLSSAPPKGVKVTFPATATSTGSLEWDTINSDGTARLDTYEFTSTSTSLSAYYKLVTDSNPTAIETLTVPVTLSFSGSSNLPLPVVTVSYVVSLAPIGTPFDADDNVISQADFPELIPRYAALDSSSATLFSVTGTTTTLLVPLAQVTFGYDTGFAISNTTADPGKSVMGFPSPVAQSGTITFYFFPQRPSPTAAVPAMFKYTTGPNDPGTGVDANGILSSGSTYTVLLSQLLTAAGASPTFQGYVFIVANFTNAHAQYVLSNFTTFSQGALALVIGGDRTVVPENLNN